ncbi:MAG: hypothetical protein C4582_05650 [Desulfobacteraceae bacterium]|jgi:hypothetical protein|nr:MAG: hypothetical protein C4582_05650 [Desulfobacteraceae bacterium]
MSQSVRDSHGNPEWKPVRTTGAANKLDPGIASFRKSTSHDWKLGGAEIPVGERLKSVFKIAVSKSMALGTRCLHPKSIASKQEVPFSEKRKILPKKG